MVEMTIESVRVSLMNYQRVVILKEKHADRYLPIWIGPAEADAIAVQLQELRVARPLTHDLLRSVIQALGANVQSIVVNDLNNDTFYARIVLDVDGRHLEIDSRPSDAIALAVRVNVPIFAEEAVLDKAGIVLDPETGKFQAARTSEEANAPVDEEERQRLSAFADFINSLDLEDFDTRK
ncbi:MAG: bifunctional nuclease family protein [Chloroflexi bacterium]|nr:bifunctional nuclease family protein [Chloroflexota bacterium]